MGDREDYVTCLRKEGLYWMEDREDYFTCLRERRGCTGWETEKTMLPV